MVMRDIIEIDDEKCNGCGECIPNCVEGALQIVNGKARLISDELCDGIGMCLGHCPQGALTVTQRDTDDFNEEAVEDLLKKREAEQELLKDKGKDQQLLKDKGKDQQLLKDKGGDQDACFEETDEVFVHHHHGDHTPCGCPGSQNMVLKKKEGASSGLHSIPRGAGGHSPPPSSDSLSAGAGESTLTHWPIKLRLVNENAPFLQDADLLVLADCAGVASYDLHDTLLKDKVVVILCPKFDDPDFFTEKLDRLAKHSGIRSITIGHMEVPCCFGLGNAVKRAVQNSGRSIPVEHIIISREGRKSRG